MSDKYSLPGYVTEILELFHNNGYEAYVVGGCVRDIILGKIPYDYDITTNALPENIIEICKNKYRTIETGIKHGTITVISQDNNLEITTYRVDGEYTDGRRPDSVFFTPNLKEDLKRRDFTINAMVLNKEGRIADYFDGVGDISKKIIRSIGSAIERFNEDALRILRALRFSSVLGFFIDKETSDAIHSEKHLLSKVSAERIYVELNKMFMSEHICTLEHNIYEYVDVLSEILDVICNENEYRKICHNVIKIPGTSELRFTYFLCGISAFATESLTTNLNKLKVSNAFRSKALAINGILSSDKPAETLYDAKKIVIHYGIKHAKDAAEIILAVMENSNLINHLKEIEENNYCVSINMLDINGNEIRDMLGVSGKEIGSLLEILLDVVMKNNVNNEKYELMEYLKTIVNKNE